MERTAGSRTILVYGSYLPFSARDAPCRPLSLILVSLDVTYNPRSYEYIAPTSPRLSRSRRLIVCLRHKRYKACESCGCRTDARGGSRRLATLVIYRPREMFGAALRPTVVLDGKNLVNVGNGKVFVAPIIPGHYTFEMDDKKSGTEVNLKSSQEIYMKIEIVPGFWKGGGKLTQVAPEQGGYEATRLDLIEPTEIEDARFR